MKVIEHLCQAVRGNAEKFNSDVEVAPCCIFWTDAKSQWTRALPKLLERLPELLVLGEYDLGRRSGPAVWLRCVIAGKVKEVELPEDRTPILYLPGIKRADLNVAGKRCEDLEPLIGLQHSSIFWAPSSNADWTIPTFLGTKSLGLKLSGFRAEETRKAILRALGKLLDLDVETLKKRPLDRSFCNDLLVTDRQGMMLKWFNDEEKFKEECDEEIFGAFVDTCKLRFDYDPDADGVLGGVEKFASHKTEEWRSVWERFCEAPGNFPELPEKMLGVSMPEEDLLSNADTHGGWPQWNEREENSLREALPKLASDAKVREKLLNLEKRHQDRRNLPWAKLQRAPLAKALEHLSVLAENTRKHLATGTFDDLMGRYCGQGWRADDAVVRVLAEVEEGDRLVVSSVLRAIYLPWLEDSARYLQKMAKGNAYPNGSSEAEPYGKNGNTYEDGECVLFVDGLRFDAGKRLAGLLKQQKLLVVEKPRWVALPSVTATGKAAVSPLPGKLNGENQNADFNPCIAETGKPLRTESFNKLLAKEGWLCLKEKNESEDGERNAWCEVGLIDQEGHKLGLELAKRIDGILNGISKRVSGLLDAGWTKVRIVTDHGWLLLPGGLPKSELPKVLTETKWKRCACLKEGASDPGQRLYPWFWNPNYHYVLADGVSCFKEGEVYTHGGLSLQECLVLELSVTSRSASNHSRVPRFIAVKWRGLRCFAEIKDGSPGMKLDIRARAADPDSSLARKTPSLNENSEPSLVIENPDLKGKSATLVLLQEDGKVAAQSSTTIGDDEW